MRIEMDRVSPMTMRRIYIHWACRMLRDHMAEKSVSWPKYKYLKRLVKQTVAEIERQYIVRRV